MSFKQPAKRREDVIIGNNIASPIMPLSCEKTIEVAVEKSVYNAKQMVGSFDLLAAYYLLDIFIKLPYHCSSYITDFLSTKNT